MNNKKKLLIIVIPLAIIIIAILSIYLIIHFQKNKDIKDIYTAYVDEDIQNRLVEISISEETDNNNTNDFEYILEQKNDESVVGVIKIDKINYEGLIYEGTDLDTLSKGVGHIESTSFFEGNVGLAAHNTRDKWAKLYTLQIGDTIDYVSFLGTKQYEVTTIQEIEETNWSFLRSSDDNKITLITCIVGKPQLRLCIQGIEK